MVKLTAATMLRYTFRLPIGNISAFLFRIGIRSGLLLMFLVGVVLIPACCSFAQQPLEFTSSENNEKPAATLTVHVNEVDLSFLVTDRHHRWVTDLSENELHLLDNGKAPQSIRFFQSRTGLPLRVGLLVDTSGSVAPQFAFEKEAAAMFISQVVDPDKDLAFVMGFNNKIAVTQDFTGDRQALASGVYQLNLDGTTAVYDAVDFACQKLMQHPEEGLSRRVLVLLTDGEDNSSRISPLQLMENTIRCNAVVVVLHTESDPNDSKPEYKILKTLTRETGGQILPADNRKKIAKAFAQLSEELRSYYLLAYHPSEFSADGSYHKIELKTSRHGARILCRRGYYAANK